MQHVPKPTIGPLTQAASDWMAQAKKGESFVYYEGDDINRVLMTPEQRMTKQARAEHEAKRKFEREMAKREGRKFKAPQVPDEYRDVKPDVMALVDAVEGWELRGLVRLRTIVLSAGRRRYEMEMLIQRNGLPGVRAREGILHGAA